MELGRDSKVRLGVMSSQLAGMAIREVTGVLAQDVTEEARDYFVRPIEHQLVTATGVQELPTNAVVVFRQREAIELPLE